MKQLLSVLFTFIVLISFSQEQDKAQLLAMKKANNYVYKGNALFEENDMVSAEMEYRKAISEQPNSVVGSYNLGTSYIKNGNFDEAVYRLEAAAKAANSKSEKHKIYHNIGNVLMLGEKCKEAVEAYKNALRNNPADEETRYNLAVAKDCAEQQQDQNQDQNQDQDQNQEDKNNSDQEQDENKENKDNQDNKEQEGDNNNQDNDKEGDQDNKEGEDNKDDKGQPENQEKDQGNEGDKEKEQQQPKPQPGQLSPQQIQNLLEAMNNQEQKVQEKMNAEKQKGVIIKTDKDW